MGKDSRGPQEAETRCTEARGRGAAVSAAGGATWEGVSVPAARFRGSLAICAHEHSGLGRAGNTASCCK